jgi:transcription-repair coupling factor (superfamily II helicase)
VSISNLLSSPILSEFCTLLSKEPSLLIEGLWDGPKAALLALIAHATKKNILVITGEKRESHLLSDLDYFGLSSFLEFPSWETLPGEEIPPSPDIVGSRFAILHKLLTQTGPHLVLCPLQAALQKLPSKEKLKPLCNLWKVGEEIPFDSLPDFLEALGYRREALVTDKGQFALRHGILDIFPLSTPDPYRLEFFGDAIESIRTFDPVGQKSLEKVAQVFLCPGSEFQLLQEEKKPALLLEYLGKNSLVVFDELALLEDRYVALNALPSSQSRYFAKIQELIEASGSLQTLYWISEQMEELSEVELLGKKGRAFYSRKEPLQPLTFEAFALKFQSKRWSHPFHLIGDFFSTTEVMSATTGEEILHGVAQQSSSALDLHLLCATPSEEEFLKNQIHDLGILLPEKTHFEQAYLSSGFVVGDSLLALLPMTEITHRYRVRRQKWRSTSHTPSSEFHALSPGDYVVHFHQGIGKYLGTEKRQNHLGQESEFLVLEYAERSKFFVPIASSYLVSRYIGAREQPPTLSELGTQRWQRTYEQAQKAILGYAEELLRLQAEREVKGGFLYPEDGPLLTAFENEFPFVETPDQLLAIEATKQDMRSAKAMDRLICGDVGYGKTEVAMRAAFKAVTDGKKQVAVLVPTTMLAMQHYETFCERMANFPLSIGALSRFLPAKTVKENLENAKNGSLDIVIGTHRLISKDVHFKDLGLIIIDEEQRFGVRAKEQLKKLKIGVDCLTLSATPIPRTLYMSLIGARDVSIINTPPQDRLPIKSHICERDPSIIQNALLRELSRDGQVYFIHNRVESITRVAEELQKLVPQAKILVGHGQMSSDELDEVYHLFKRGEADILVATTIVESGVDIPNANTILIDRADSFGLADLYQLRGRVGRWNRPAYAYFLVAERRELRELSHKRLSALLETSGYGGGMKVALRDLEIRGAGDILGLKQSGQIASIGFHLYCKLLRRTVEAMKKKASPRFIETKMEFTYDARFPEDYIDSAPIRMELYHRLGEAMTFEEVDALLLELIDRFGKPPPPVIWLIHMTRIRIRASQLGFTLLKFDRLTLLIEKKQGKETLRHSFVLPVTKDPKVIEEHVCGLLSKLG